jgi:hypothetical protein
MCIKIIGNEEIEFNIDKPLVRQIEGATKIQVNYDPLDPKIASFLKQIEIMAVMGQGFSGDIHVNPNNRLDGLKFERRVEKIKKALNINEVIKGLARLHSNTDNRLSELSELCLGRSNE